MGGLVGISTGTIEACYAAGRASFAPPLLAPIPLAVLALLVASLVVVGLIISNPPTRPVNNVVEPEGTQLAIPKADLPDLPQPSEGERHSVSFSTSTEATANLATGEVDLNYQSTNPQADHKVVVQLRFSTGVVIAESGAIMPGYEITGMKLTDRAMGELKPGRYSAYVYMIPYSVEDESRGFTGVAVWMRSRPFEAPPVEAAAVEGIPTPPDEVAFGYGEAGSERGFSVGLASKWVRASDGSLPVWFANPAENEARLMLRISRSSDGKVIFESGLLSPGTYVESLRPREPLDAEPIEVEAAIYSFDEDYLSLGTLRLPGTVA